MIKNRSIKVIRNHATDIWRMIDKSYIIGTLMWYFVYYCAPIADGALTIGVVACLLFGTALHYLIYMLDNFAAKSYIMALMSATACGYFMYTVILILLVLDRKPPLTFPVATPFGINVHLVIPTFATLSIVSAYTIVFIYSFFKRRIK